MLHQLKSPQGATKKRKRVGRGNASGRGTYATRGLKGQKARAGASGFKRRGLKTYLTQTPKLGGFKSHKPPVRIVSLKQIEAIGHDNETINLKKLVEHKLAKSPTDKVKVLGPGSLSKKVTVVVDSFSKSAADAILKAGGKAIIRSSKE